MFQLVVTTCPDEPCAQQLAKALVEKRLAACVSIIPNVQSIYHWQGEVQQDVEWQLTCKTLNRVYEELEQTITELHPYDVPEIIATEITAGSPSYLQWINENVKS